MLDAFLALLQPTVLFYWFAGMVFGVFVGATPGLTATMGVALVIPISFYLPPEAGLAMILGVSFMAIFAGDIPATYLRIPGTPASAVATLDSFAMAQQGRSEFAMMLNLWCSVIGGTIGVVLLIVAAWPLARAALNFTHYEYFWLALLGLSLSALVSAGAAFRGILAAMAGMLLGTVGLDMVSGTARFTFGSTELAGGLGFIAPMIGLFGIPEVLRNVQSRGAMTAAAVAKSDRASAREVTTTIWRHKWTVLRSSLVGTFIGALPGAGADVAAWVAYGIAQRVSSNKDKFGTGIEEGIIAPTSANEAAIGGAWIPALVLGIPGDSVTAIVLGALLVYDIKPGPQIFEPEHITKTYSLFMIALITQVLAIPAGYAGIRAFGWILRMPRSIVMTGVLVFSVLGAYAIRNSMFDVWLMIAFGLLGYVLEKVRVPLAPLILGMILGPMVEESLRVGLIKSSGDLSPFFLRPICAVVLMLFIAGLAIPRLMSRRAASVLPASKSKPDPYA